MEYIGTVSSLWRHPISSLGGEPLSTARIEKEGMVGDRCFCIFDLETGEVARPETSLRWRSAPFLKAAVDENGVTTICFPNSAIYHLTDAALAPMLRSHFGFEVGVGQYCSSPTSADIGLPVVASRYTVAPLHLLTSASLNRLQEICPEKIDERRFRPSLCIASASDGGFLESGWIACNFLIGNVGLTITEHTKRCGMTFIAQPGLNENPEILRAVVRQNRRQLGVYCDVTNPGTLAIGMAVRCLDTSRISTC